MKLFGLLLFAQTCQIIYRYMLNLLTQTVIIIEDWTVRSQTKRTICSSFENLRWGVSIALSYKRRLAR